MKRYRSRKFLIALALIGCTTWLASQGRMEGFDITVVFGLVGGGYGFANHLAKKGEDAK